MITNNTIPALYPAFNRSLLELETSNFLKEKHNYITDILTDKTTHDQVIDAFFFGYSGLIAVAGGVGTKQYTPGDFVLVRTISATTDYSGIYKVVAVPNDVVIVLDTPFTNSVNSAVIEVYRIYRQKLPANPQGRAIFDVNGYATGVVYHDFALDNVSAFNVPNSFDKLNILPSEEYYQNPTYNSVVNNGGLAEVVGVSATLFVGQTIELRADNVLLQTYDGIAQVVSINGSDVTINKGYGGTVISTGQIITLPKVPVWYRDFNDITSEKIIFNGALPYPGILDFDGDVYDVSLLATAEFLTTAPAEQKIKLDDRAYTQFFQSIDTTATQWAVDVTDELGAVHQYIINFDMSPDNFLGLAVGPYDINQIPAGLFDTIPARGLPVIVCTDKSYKAYLWGENTCNIIGVQTTNFAHPYGAVLNSITWAQQQAIYLEIEVTTLEIGGVPQAITPTGTQYNEATVTSQLNEEIYSNEIGLQTGLIIQSALAFGSGSFSSHWLDIDFAQDFELVVRVKLQSSFLGSSVILDVSYTWDVASCTTSYKVLNGSVLVFQTKGEARPVYYTSLPGFIGLSSTLTAPDALTEKLCFELDYTPYAYSGARVLFQDRLGSFMGYNFNLKRARRIETSSDGYEKDVLQITGNTTITRGFETIQNSWAEEWDLLTDFLSEDDAKYLEECYTSPSIFIQFKGEVLPATIKPRVQTAQEKENTALRQVAITLRVNRTQYTQRN